MCKICSRIGARYFDQVPAFHRRIVDAARHACNGSSSDSSTAQTLIGGFALSPNKNPGIWTPIESRKLQSTRSHALELHQAALIINSVAILAFESLDDSWPDIGFFRALQDEHPSADILRIIHRTGNVQYLNLDDAMNHYNSLSIAA